MLIFYGSDFAELHMQAWICGGLAEKICKTVYLW